MTNLSSDNTSADVLVAHRLRELRTSKGLSLRVLADLSGLNINTLSLIENGKSSPSVSTLQQLAQALAVPVAAFFESESVEKQVVYTLEGKRPFADFGGTQMQNLGKDLAGNAVQPFVVTLKPGMGSGDRMIVHTGHEFVFCLRGTIDYRINEESYSLSQGDSLVFEAHLPHRWSNSGEDLAQILLLLYPSDQREQPGGRHFSLDYITKELTMKIAFITEDGKNISQHFGRAPFYLVLSIEEGKVINREMRDKAGHKQFHNQSHSEGHHGAGHGMDSASQDKHIKMLEPITDCEAVICGGMGMGAYETIRRHNIRPVLTDLRDIDAAAQAFIEGKLIDHTELLH
jgi:transcriptional regulator with XRE-family HTH domain/predicted Fe-Mo cluster-binding NifX family protein